MLTTRGTAARLVRVFDRLQDLHPDMTLLQAATLMTVAAHPGITIRELYDRLGAKDSTTSRTVAILSDLGGRRVAPLNLIEMKVNPEDRREKNLSLTAKGERLIEAIQGDLGPTAES